MKKNRYPKGEDPSVCQVKGLSTFLQCLRKFLLGTVPEGGNRYDVEYLREWVFTAMSLMLRYPLSLALLYGAYLFLQEGNLALAIVEVTVIFLIWLVFIIRPIRRHIGKQSIIFLMSGFSVLLLLSTGCHGAGLIALLLTSIVSNALLDRKGNNILLGMHSLILLGLSILYGLGVLDGLAISNYGNTWYINGLTVLLAILGQHFVWNIIYNGLASQIERYNLAIHGTHDGIWDWDIEADNFYISDRYMEQLGYSPLELSSSYATATSLIHPEDRSRAESHLQSYLNGDIDHYAQTFRMRHKSGDYRIIEARGAAVRDENGRAIRIAGSHTDITERVEKEERIRYLSDHDQLTGLLNFNAFRGRLEAPPSPRGNAILFMDIDNFRLVNDTLGSEGGDHLLVDLAERFRLAAGTFGVPYRYEGDEFLLLMETSDPQVVRECGKKILEALYDPIRIDHRIFIITASIGAAVLGAREDLETCLREADTALYVAKRKKNNLTFYEPSMKAIRTREKMFEEDMVQALESGQFSLYYQPVYSIEKQRITQVEALLRWNHPQLGMIGPGEFIPIAERTKFILPLTDWVLEQVCRQLAIWQDTPLSDLIVAVNLSFLSLENRQKPLIEVVRKLLSDHKIQAERLEFEITETLLMNNSEDVIAELREIRKGGIRLSLDDFGTGYSSFGYLKDLPLDTIKLDRSLIRHIDIDPKERLIATSICTIAHSLGLKIVAEGVETLTQYSELKKAGADFIQGFLFSKALPVLELEAYCQKELKMVP